MEGIRRLGIVLQAIAVIWVLIFGGAALFAAIGTERDLTFDERRALYEQNTGNSLEKVAEARKVEILRGASESGLDKWLGTNDQSAKVLGEFFASRKSTITVRDWGDVTFRAILAAVGGATFGAFGWIVAGFAVKREAR
jgi:hypothetical protein